MVATLLLGHGLSVTLAQPVERQNKALKPWAELDLRSGWNIDAGFGAAVFPEFPGSRDYRILPLPMLSATWKDRLLLNPIAGIRLSLAPGEAFTVGPVVKYVRGRSNRGDLADLTRVSGGFAGGVFANYRLGELHLDGEVLHALSGAQVVQRRLGKQPLRHLG